MAIGQCRECNKEVSSEATSCPHCGVPKPVRQKVAWTGCLVAIIVILGGGSLLLELVGRSDPPRSSDQTSSNSTTPVNASDSPSSEATPSPEEQARTIALNMASLGIELLRRNLRNPDSFALEDAELMGSGAFCITYRGQNGFGGMNREHAVLDERSKTFEIEDQPKFAAAWRRYCKNKAGTDVTEELKSRAEIAKATLPKAQSEPE